MKRHLITIACLAAIFIACANGQLTVKTKGPTNQSTAVELPLLQGTWEGVQVGEEAKITITITGNSLHFHRDKNFWFETTMTLPAGKAPKQLHATIKDCAEQGSIGEVVKAFYKIADGTLTLATIGDDAEETPESFEAAGTRYELRKVKSQQKNIEPPKTGAPNSITRSIIQDNAGNIWMATWEGVYRYDGKSFVNMTAEVSSARFFSALEDRKGNLWFGSIGSGVFRYDGKSFQNLTTKDGLPNNEIVSIYEDQAGHLWFGVNGGVSRYDGESFRNYLTNGGSLAEDGTGKTIPDFTRPPDGVNSMVEDKTGRLWFARWGEALVFDGKAFSTFAHEGKSFTNVRSVIEDRKGNIWLGGANGLWRYDGSTLTNITENFVGYIHEDAQGNIWTGSEQRGGGKWVLSRYDSKSLEDKNPTVSEIGNAGMIFGIQETNDGSICFGALDGVHRYDGNAVTHFKSDKNQK